MAETTILVIALLLSIVAFLNIRKVHKRLNTLEIVLAKKNLLTWNDPAWNLNDDDKKLLKELDR